MIPRDDLALAFQSRFLTSSSA